MSVGLLLALCVVVVLVRTGGAADRPAAPEADAKDGAGFNYLVPAVVRTPGLEGTQWRTALSIVNRSGDGAYFRLRYHRRWQSHEITGAISNWSTTYWSEVLAGFDLDPEGRYSGILEIVSDRPLLICARVYNQTEHGTLGQGMPALVPGDGLQSTGILPMLERSAAYRTNVGFLNLSSTTCTVHVDVYSEAGGASPLGSRVTTELPPHRWAQIDDVFEAAGIGGNVWTAYASVMLEPVGCEVWSYASVVDNQTGDATTIPVLAVEAMPGR